MPILELCGSTLCLLAYVRFAPLLRTLGSKLQQPQPVDTDSTWSTKKGEVYEDVETFFVRAGTVTFRHKDGTARLPVSELTETTRAELIQRYHQNHSLAILPRENEVREVGNFEVEAA